MDGRISNLSEVASVRRYTLTEGKASGIDVLDCDNGRIRFLVNLSFAADIMQLYHEGQNMSFVSKNGFSGSRGDFLSRFEGGMLYTCGLDCVGAREGSAIHGSLHTTPAELIRASCDEGGIVIEAKVACTALFGRDLTLLRKISTAISSDTVKIEDTLINGAYRDEKYALLYHINIGYPMLDEGAAVIADIAEKHPRNEWSRCLQDESCDISAAIPNIDENCYFLKLNEPNISLLNNKLGKKFTVSYSGDTLPHFVEWKSMAAGDYALGFEPATTELDDRFEYKTIAAGEKIEFKIELKVEKI